MKKLLFLLFLMFIFSCEKEPICWECVTQQTKTKSITNKYCDKTSEEIRKIEELGTFDHNLFGIPWRQTTKCKIKN